MSHEFSKGSHSALCVRGEILVINAWNVRTLMNVESQAIIIHTLSKYNMHIVLLPEVCIHNSREPKAVTIPGSTKKYWLHHIGISNNSKRSRIAIIKNHNQFKSYGTLYMTSWPHLLATGSTCPKKRSNIDRGEGDLHAYPLIFYARQI